MMLTTQILGITNHTWKLGKQSLDNLTKSRVALNLIAQDLQMGVFRRDAPAFVDDLGVSASASGQYAFYSMRGSDADRKLILINYRLNTSGTTANLQRGTYSLNYSGTNTIAYGSTKIPQLSSIKTNEYQELAAGVIAFKLFFIHGDQYDSNYLDANGKPAIAVGVTIAVVDEKTQQQLQRQNKLQALINSTVFAVPSSLQESLKYTWEQAIKQQKFYFTGGFPPDIGTGLKVFERIIYLPSNAQ